MNLGEVCPAAVGICERLTAHGYRALLAGGCVRDLLLGIEPKDYDVATDATPEEVARIFPKTIPVGAAFGVQMVCTPEGIFEVTTFRKDGPYLDGRHPAYVEFAAEQDDAQRRDFTINAMFYDTRNDQVIDYVGGHEDLERGLVRTVGDPEARFAEDRLRLLRAVRFAARFDYAIEDATLESIAARASSIGTVSPERIRDEVLKMLTEGRAHAAFLLLDETGLLEQVLPEIARMKGVEQPADFHPEGDVFTHTMLMLELLDRPSATLALGVLLHDVGKPLTQTREDRIRFSNHDKIGAAITRDICHRLRLSSMQLRRVEWLVEQHMRFAAAPSMRESKLKRFMREDGFLELIELCRIDSMASHGDLGTVRWVEERMNAVESETMRPARVFGGDDLIAMGYLPGPRFKEILDAIEDAQLEGMVGTREEVRAFVRERWAPPDGLNING